MIDSKEFPELAKMQAVQSESQAIGEFIEWLGANGMQICTTASGLRGTIFYPVLQSTDDLLARHFNIDLQAVERERRTVLAELPKH